GISWDDVDIAIPAFLTIILMPFTYSISVGIGAGFLSYVLIKVVKGKAAQVHPLLWVVAALFVAYFAIHPVTTVLTSPPSLREHARRTRRVVAYRQRKNAESSYDDSAFSSVGRSGML